VADAVSENVSENPGKPKRGRQPSLDATAMSMLRSWFPEIRTRRGQQNRWHALHALNVLDYDPAFRWLVPSEEAIHRGEGSIRFSVLNEVGRIADDGELRAVAAVVCERQLKTREAVAFVRRCRVAPRPGSATALTNAVIGCVNAYVQQHPDTTLRQIRAALENAGGAFEQANGEAEPADEEAPARGGGGRGSKG
jgi:hypothetical protein